MTVIHNALAAAQQREEEAVAARQAFLQSEHGSIAEHVNELDTSPHTIYCHVAADGQPTTNGHVESFAGIGYDETHKAAEAAGWVKSGYGWVCPACAKDVTPVQVFKVRLHGMNGPCVHRTVNSTLDELRELMENWAYEWEHYGTAGEPLDRITITNGKITRGQLNCLREFDGY